MNNGVGIWFKYFVMEDWGVIMCFDEKFGEFLW